MPSYLTQVGSLIFSSNSTDTLFVLTDLSPNNSLIRPYFLLLFAVVTKLAQVLFDNISAQEKIWTGPCLVPMLQCLHERCKVTDRWLFDIASTLIGEPELRHCIHEPLNECLSHVLQCGGGDECICGFGELCEEVYSVLLEVNQLDSTLLNEATLAHLKESDSVEARECLAQLEGYDDLSHKKKVSREKATYSALVAYLESRMVNSTSPVLTPYKLCTLYPDAVICTVSRYVVCG